MVNRQEKEEEKVKKNKSDFTAIYFMYGDEELCDKYV